MILSGFPGIGESTAGAIMSLAYQIPYPILDANVKRVISRYESVDNDSTHKSNKKLWIYLINILQEKYFFIHPRNNGFGCNDLS